MKKFKVARASLTYFFEVKVATLLKIVPITIVAYYIFVVSNLLDDDYE